MKTLQTHNHALQTLSPAHTSVQDVANVFERKVLAKVPYHMPSDVCWPWQGGRHNTGYGYIVNPKKRNSLFLAHRKVFEIFNQCSIIDKKAVVRHLCGKGREGCVNPFHLALGTHAENMADTIIHGTNRPGEKSHNAKLKNADVIRIRKRYAYGGVTMKQLAEEYNITLGTIHPLIHRKTWKNI